MFVRPVLRMDQARLDRGARRGVRVLRRGAAPAGAGQPEDRGGQARPVRPEDQPVLCRAGRPLRGADRPGPGAQAEGQATGRAADAVCPRLVLARPRVRLARADAGRRAGLVTRGRRAALVPAAGGRRAAGGVRRGRGRRRCNRCRASAFVLATWSTATVGPDIHVKVGKTLYSVPWRFIGPARRRPRDRRPMVQIFHHGRADRHPRPSSRRASRPTLGHYPPEKIAFRMRTPTWCRTRAAEIGPACRAGHRRPAARSTPCSGCAPPKACSAWPTSTAPPGWRPPAPRRSRSVTRPTAPSRASWPPAPRPTRHQPATGDGGAAAHLHGPAAVRERHRPAHHDAARRWTTTPDGTTTTPLDLRHRYRRPAATTACRPERARTTRRPDWA